MAEKKVETVTLIAPNGQTVSVARSKLEERLRNGYRLPEKRPQTKGRAAQAAAGQAFRRLDGGLRPCLAPGCLANANNAAMGLRRYEHEVGIRKDSPGAIRCGTRRRK